MARTTNDALVISVEARLTQIEKSMARAQAVASKGYGALSRGSAVATAAIERDFDRAARNVDRNVSAMSRRAREFGTSFKGGLVGSFSAGFVGGAAASLLTELPRAIKETLTSLSNLKAEASRAGIDVESYQQLAYAAGQANIPVDALTDGIKELQLRADEFVVSGGGPAAEAFKRLGYTAEELKSRLADPSELFGDIIERLRQLDSAAQIRVLDEIFGGTAGERFGVLLSDSIRSLREMQAEARNIGAVIESDVIDKAAELEAQYNKVGDVIWKRWATGVVATAQHLVTMQGHIENITKALGEAGNSPFWKQVRSTFWTDEEAAKGNLQWQLNSRAWGNEMPPVPTRDEWLRGGTTDPTTASPAPAPAQGAAAPSGVSPAMQYSPAPGSAGGAAAATRDMASALDLAAASARSQSEAYFEAIDAADRLGESQAEAARTTTEAYTSIAKDAVGGLISDLRNGVSAADAMANALDRVADRLIDMALDAVFDPKNFQGMFQGMFQGGGGAPMNLLPKAGGGPVRRGGAYLVGERRPELFIPNTAGTILPNPRAMPAGGGRGGDANVSVNVINASGEKVETREQRTDLGRTVEVLVGNAIGSGKFDKPMAGRYGARPMTTRRGK